MFTYLLGKCFENSFEKGSGLFVSLGDVRVLIQPEHSGVVLNRETLDVVNKGGVFSGVVWYVVHGSVIGARWLAEGVVGQVVDVVVVEVGQQTHHQTSVPLVRHSAPVVALSSQIHQRVHRNLLVVIQKHLNIRPGNIQGGNAVRDMSGRAKVGQGDFRENTLFSCQSFFFS